MARSVLLRPGQAGDGGLVMRGQSAGVGVARKRWRVGSRKPPIPTDPWLQQGPAAQTTEVGAAGEGFSFTSNSRETHSYLEIY